MRQSFQPEMNVISLWEEVWKSCNQCWVLVEALCFGCVFQPPLGILSFSSCCWNNSIHSSHLKIFFIFLLSNGIYNHIHRAKMKLSSGLLLSWASRDRIFLHLLIFCRTLKICGHGSIFHLWKPSRLQFLFFLASCPL